jgi:hypothetical protein
VYSVYSVVKYFPIIGNGGVLAPALQLRDEAGDAGHGFFDVVERDGAFTNEGQPFALGNQW